MIIKSILSNVNITTLPIIYNKLNSIHDFGKGRLKKLDNTEVMYELECKNCSATYVGETKRALKERLREHKNSYNKNSVLSLHQYNTWQDSIVNRRSIKTCLLAAPGCLCLQSMCRGCYLVYKCCDIANLRDRFIGLLWP